MSFLMKFYSNQPKYYERKITSIQNNRQINIRLRYYINIKSRVKGDHEIPSRWHYCFVQKVTGRSECSWSFCDYLYCFGRWCFVLPQNVFSKCWVWYRNFFKLKTFSIKYIQLLRTKNLRGKYKTQKNMKGK